MSTNLLTAGHDRRVVGEGRLSIVALDGARHRSVLLFWALLLLGIIFFTAATLAAQVALSDAVEAKWRDLVLDVSATVQKGDLPLAEQRLAALIEEFSAPELQLPRNLARLILARLLVVQQKDLPGAKALLQDAEVFFGESLGAESPELIEAWHLEGRILLLERDEKGAEEVLRKALAIAKRVFGMNSPLVGNLLADLASTYIRMGRNDIAKPIKERAEQILTGSMSAFSSSVSQSSEAAGSGSLAEDANQSVNNDEQVGATPVLSRGSRAYILSLAIILFFTAIHFLLSFGRLESYFRFGIFWCVFSLALGALAVLLADPLRAILSVRMGLLIVSLLAVLNLMVSTLGMSYCSYSAISDAPFLRALLRRRSPTVPWKTFALSLAIVTLGSVGYAYGMAQLFSLPQLIGPLVPGGRILTAGNSLAALLAVFLFVGISEALIFRLFLQNFVAAVARLSTSRYLLAVTVAATLWSLGHAQLVGVGPFRILQLVPIGIALGELARRQGIEASVIAQVMISLCLFYLGAS